jgi:hypothetical protein
MPLMPPTKDLMTFLQKNLPVRSAIAAPPNATMLYSGSFIRPVWKEIEQLKLTNREIAKKQLLPDVLAKIRPPGTPYPTLLAWAKALDALVPWKDNGFVAWRALSGIFASNAVGTVSFCIGSGITKSDKVFAATELPVLLRNPNIDAVTKDVLSYYLRCVQRGQSEINFGFIGG